jgi:hypothetical protein
MSEVDMTYVGGNKDKNNIFDFHDMKTTNTFELFSQGSYGCVTYPRIRCDTGRKDTQNKKSISKLTTKTFYTENEYVIGEVLNNIKRELKSSKNMEELEIMDHLNYVESKCEIKKEKLRINRKKHKCKVIDKEDSKVVLLKAKFIKSVEMSEFLFEKFSMKLLIRYYYFVLSCMKFLHSHNIVHHDLHLGNVLIDESKKFHLIDFGISIHVPRFYDKENLDFEYMKKIILNFDPSWRFWPMEYHILAFYAFKKKALDERTLTNILDEYFKGDNKQFFGHYFGKMENYKRRCFEFLRDKYVNDVPIEEHCRYIIDNAAFSWDIYQVNYIVLYILKLYNIGYAYSLVELLKTGLHFDFERRHNAEYYLDAVLSIAEQQRNISESMFTMNENPLPMTKDKDKYLVLSSSRINH